MNTQRQYLMRWLAYTYVATAVAIFGLAWNLDYERPRHGWDDRNPLRALGAAAFWPLYVSVKVFSPLKGADECAAPTK